MVSASALAGTLLWGLSPIGHEHRKGFWPLGADARWGAKLAAIDPVPGKAAVSASYQFDGHLTHREKIYEFPNPFKRRTGVCGMRTIRARTRRNG